MLPDYQTTNQLIRMGQKVHPKSYRLGIIYGWQSKWFSHHDYRRFLRDDTLIRNFIKKKLIDGRIDNIEIERRGSGDDIIINIYTAKPGLVIGRGGGGIEEMKTLVEKKVLAGRGRVKINIHEVRQASLAAAVVAQNIAADLVRRIPFRRAAKQAIDQVQKAGAKGVKIRFSGRLNGAEIARRETFNWGSVPLHTLRANIDFGQETAFTTYGTVGVAVWIYKGDVFHKQEDEIKTSSEGILDEFKKISKKGRYANTKKS